AGQVAGLYGRKIGDSLRAGTAYHLYLAGPRRGVFNAEGLRGQKEVILCEAVIDALTFWCAGYRNVTASWGVEGFTADHLALIRASGIERVIIAYDRDEAGDAAAVKLAGRLMEEGFGCYRLRFPHGLDANEYALRVTPAVKSLGVLIRSAEWLGNGKRPVREAVKSGAQEVQALRGNADAEVTTTAAPEPALSLAAKDEPEPEVAPAEVAQAEVTQAAALQVATVAASVEPAAPELAIECV
ncbi:toprim domain-containing protein, partial [Paraburkholderia sediminicola]|uniref:toprim domain-containing protein n=1 Tax=Paraburkholderia sediminicola TaxID=458836 RepID=UPI0038B9A766